MGKSLPPKAAAYIPRRPEWGSVPLSRHLCVGAAQGHFVILRGLAQVLSLPCDPDDIPRTGHVRGGTTVRNFDQGRGWIQPNTGRARRPSALEEGPGLPVPPAQSSW